MDPKKQICQFIPNSFKEIRNFMSENLLTRTFYDPIDYEPCGFVTMGFIKWWDAYYNQFNRSLDEIIAGVDRRTAKIKEAEKEATEKEKEEARKKLSQKKELIRGNLNPRKQLQKDGVNPKSTSILEKTIPTKSAHSVSGNSSKEVSSKSKESTNSNKDKQTISNVERTEDSANPEPEPILPDPIQTQHQIQNQDKPRSEPSSGGYSRSPSPVNVEEANIEKIKKALKPNVKKLISPLKEKKICLEKKYHLLLMFLFDLAQIEVLKLTPGSNSKKNSRKLRQKILKE
ncbi:hypothetical protein PIB30_038112 [Stylosanthes scabra]|uniref:Uncharacterized protein n=1 Tax=Stylosanthes scabra TaxID=79078 RepID=A0ABU6SDU6_9FABA|nr:hypothetical protein [Stylosanthes scabra]